MEMIPGISYLVLTVAIPVPLWRSLQRIRLTKITLTGSEYTVCQSGIAARAVESGSSRCIMQDRLGTRLAPASRPVKECDVHVIVQDTSLFEELASAVDESLVSRQDQVSAETVAV